MNYAPIYDSLARTALEKIREYGDDVTIRHYPGVPSRDYDPATGSADIGPVEEYAVRGLVMDKLHSSSPLQAVDGRLIDFERAVLVAADDLPVRPVTGDAVVIKNLSWDVVGVTTIEPGGRAIYHEVYLRLGEA